MQDNHKRLLDLIKEAKSLANEIDVEAVAASLSDSQSSDETEALACQLYADADLFRDFADQVIGDLCIVLAKISNRKLLAEEAREAVSSVLAKMGFVSDQ